MSPETIDASWLRSAALILMMLAFLGIWAWAWSRNRKETFDHASKLPLEEDDGQIPQPDSNAETTKE